MWAHNFRIKMKVTILKYSFSSNLFLFFPILFFNYFYLLNKNSYKSVVVFIQKRNSFHEETRFAFFSFKNYLTMAVLTSSETNIKKFDKANRSQIKGEAVKTEGFVVRKLKV